MVELRTLEEFLAIRQEIVKWVKALEDISKIKYNHGGFCITCGEHKSYSNGGGPTCSHGDLATFIGGEETGYWVDCLKHIFNITEEDLK